MRLVSFFPAVAAIVLAFAPVASASTPCPLSTVSPSVTICTPTMGSTVTSPFQVSAGTTDNTATVIAMKVYLDYVGVYTVNANVVNTTLSAAPGSHHLTVNAWDSSGAVFKTSLTFTVSARTVTVSPSNVAFTGQVVGTTSAPQTVTLTNGTSGTITVGTPTISGDFLISSNACGSSLAANTSCTIQVEFQPTATGTRTGTLTITDSPDVNSPHNVGLSGSGLSPSACTPSTVNPSVTICTPVNGATVTSPFQVVAETTDSHTVTAMKIYLDNVGIYTVNASQLNTTVSAGVGTHNLTINAWDSTGAVFKATSIITVSSSSPPPPPPPGFVGVLTYHNDNFRTGQNLTEVSLTPANVNAAQFGKLFAYSVDGAIYGQPLYVPGLSINGGTHNVVYVATENDSVYAFDADGGGLLWKRSFINPSAGITIIPQADVGSTIYPGVGITSTPVIDLGSGTIYVVAATKENGSYFQRLHALSLTSGSEQSGSPVAIGGSVAGTGSGTSGGSVAFQPEWELQRAALLLDGGRVYIAFASEGDNGPFHGWVFAYDATTLARVGIWNATPNGGGAGIWHAGGGLAADANGNIYGITGNGTFDAASGGYDFGDSFFKLTFGTSLGLTDYFTPYNQSTLAANDWDLGSGGPLLLPDQSGPFPHLMIGGGKQGVIYVLNRDSLGHFQSGSNSQIVQSISGALASSFSGDAGMINGTPAYFNGWVYFVCTNDVPKQFTMTNGLLSTSATSKNSHTYPFPGAVPAISANGNSSAIVWTIEKGSPGALHAYDATNLATELYNSNMNSTRDSTGSTVKFSVPTVANGKVYVGTTSQLIAYGLLP
jgi:hypothetical protein